MNSSSTTLPAGWTVSQGRETVQQSNNGSVLRGCNFILTGPTGNTITVFVPEALYNSPDVVAQMFLQKIEGVNSIIALGG